ncbi:MAG: Fe-S-containing protein [Christensenellales bacterium]
MKKCWINACFYMLVCQNCGNKFKISSVEKIRNGCNPVPVTSGDKTETGDIITISGEFLNQNKILFEDWKR